MRVYRYTPGTSASEKKRQDESERIRAAARAMQQGRREKFLASRFDADHIERAKAMTGRRVR